MITEINRLILPFLATFIMALFFTPLSMKFAHMVNAIDSPESHRKIHNKPIPRLGGLSIFFAVIFGTLFFSNYPTIKLIGIILGSTIIVLTGVLDDIYDLSAKTKLALQILAASIVVIFGIRIEIFTNFFGSTDYIALGLLSIPATIFWIVGITNTVNLIDGLDGLAAGTAFIASVVLAYISLINNRYETAVLLIVLAGSTLGFLPYNYNPARVFMGDSGALFLGFYLSIVSVLGAVKGATALAYFVPVLALGLPIFDTSFAILRRFFKNKPIMTADRGHLHHRLLDIGLTHKHAVLILYLISTLLGLSAMFFLLSKYISLIITLILVIIIVSVPINRTTNLEE